MAQTQLLSLSVRKVR